MSGTGSRVDSTDDVRAKRLRWAARGMGGLGAFGFIVLWAFNHVRFVDSEPSL